MKKEIKICLPVYKIVYSLVFVFILSIIRGIENVFEIGGALQAPVAILTVIFCADTYLTEAQNKRAGVFGLYSLKRRTICVYRRLAIQMIYLIIISIIGYGLFYWQRPVVLYGDTSSNAFWMFMTAIWGTVLFWGVFSMTVCNLFKNVWMGIGSAFLIWMGLFSKGGDDFFGKWNLFSYLFREVEVPNNWSWMCGTMVTLALAVILIILVPFILKKRG